MSSLSPSRNSEAGYTLIEIVVAIAILAILATMVSLTFSSTSRIVEAIDEEHGREHQARICLTRITEELMMARLQRRFPWSARNGERDGRPADLLAFVSASHVRYRPDVAEADLTRVLYTREGDRLARFSLRNLQGLVPQAVERVDLATGVTAWNLRYYDGALRAWVDEWDEQSRKSLPRAVMIELTLINARNEPKTFFDWVVIPEQSL